MMSFISHDKLSAIIEEEDGGISEKDYRNTAIDIFIFTVYITFEAMGAFIMHDIPHIILHILQG